MDINSQLNNYIAFGYLCYGFICVLGISALIVETVIRFKERKYHQKAFAINSKCKFLKSIK